MEQIQAAGDDDADAENGAVGGNVTKDKIAKYRRADDLDILERRQQVGWRLAGRQHDEGMAERRRDSHADHPSRFLPCQRRHGGARDRQQAADKHHHAKRRHRGDTAKKLHLIRIDIVGQAAR